jgi:hypothetical protein
MWAITDREAVDPPIARGAAGENVRVMTQTDEGVAERLCELAARAGRKEPCAEDSCPLWENGECSLERLLTESADDDAAPNNGYV